MTSKGKAIELVNMYLQIYDGRVPQAKKCALIAVDEILNAMKKVEFRNPYNIYWQEVKQEINKL